MSAAVVRLSIVFRSSLQPLSTNGARAAASFHTSCGGGGGYWGQGHHSATVQPSALLLSPSTPATVCCRYASFFNRLPAASLWKGVTTVSKAGAKKGSGRSKMRPKNFNKGQVIGVGDVNIVWPGLNSPIIKDRELMRVKNHGRTEDRQKELIKIRDSMSKFSHFKKVNALERGWTGGQMGGNRVGPPDAVGDDRFEGFQTIILESKGVVHMTGNMGRMRSLSVFVVTGNGNGLVGIALAKSPKAHSSIRMAKNMASKQLLYVERHREFTVLHDFFTQFGCTRIFVKKSAEGQGLVCHRVIKAICQMAGIKDMYAKIEGAVNTQNLAKAFILGLLNQKTYQEVAEEKRLHVVEFQGDNNVPTVLASPQQAPVRTLEDIRPSENMDFTVHMMDDRVPLVRKKFESFITRTAGYEFYLKKYQYFRNSNKTRQELLNQYGEVKSFLHDKHPECRVFFDPSKRHRATNDDDDN